MGDPGKIPRGRVTLAKPWRQVRISQMKKVGGAIRQRYRIRGKREHGMPGHWAVFLEHSRWRRGERRSEWRE